MPVTVPLDFSLGDRVRIPAIERNGRVIAIYISDSGVQYQVRYFDDGKPQVVYFYHDELKFSG